MRLISQKTPVFSYRDDDFEPKETVLPKEEYERVALAKLVIACADILITSPKDGVIYLARRVVEPCVGWWGIGGRQRIDQTSVEAAQAHLKQDTRITLPQERFQFLGLFEYLSVKNRQGTGISHTLAATYLVKLTELELETLLANGTSSRPDEYEARIEPFDRARIEKTFAQGELPDAIRKMYDLAFPEISY